MKIYFLRKFGKNLTIDFSSGTEIHTQIRLDPCLTCLFIFKMLVNVDSMKHFVGFALISAYKQPLMLKDVVDVFQLMLKTCC